MMISQFARGGWTEGHSDGIVEQPQYQLLPMTSEDIYRQVSNISRTFVGNKIVDHSDAVGASPVGAAPPTTSSFST